ncbi:MAG: hypothetical protein HY606_14210 [Planctomycetes bacterium]|nr:hypothetical protein [Planctomycetota bacterium]
MSKKSYSMDDSLKIAELLDELVKILLLSITNINSEKKLDPSTLIVELNKRGLAPIRIAELLGTTTKTVNPTLSRSRKSKKK